MITPQSVDRKKRFSLRAATALGGVLVLAALGGSPAVAELDPGKDLRAQAVEHTGAVPGGFGSWQELLATQERLVKAAERVTAAGGAGYAGVVAAPENRELRVYWKGDVPKKIGKLVGELRAGVPVSVLPASYSARELEREGNRLIRKAGSAITSVAAKPDGSGLTVGTAGGFAANSALADAAVPVTVEAGVRPQLATRWDDSPPWWGGGAWRNASTGGGCSTGFAVSYGGVSRMLSAGHCGDVPQTATDPTGQVIGPISHDNNSRDVLLINGTSAGRVFNNTPGSPPPSEFSNPVIGTSGSVVGMWICTSGAYSGTNCNIQVKTVNVTINVGYLIFGTVHAEQVNGTNAVGQGDSGGSVEVVNPNNTLQVYAAGVNTAIDGNTAVACTGYVTTGRICAWRMYYAPWSNATTAFPGITIITG
ncbi:hypothetical protein [Sphaerisporangium sp. TRM90804]|uniref:hypothetical protein n=1 Tax=Sphaerisporangium sp. TRM90804 TaxID=3031113 RepID=UPI002446E9FA|nr:hypothetical protein [Sphaerisporangium sp. TRM90804]MDH2429896.1 hypothetical protein [Sphaerisporangium sp. TRM90804]